MHVILGMFSKENPVLLICNVGALAQQYGRSTTDGLSEMKSKHQLNSVELLTHAHVS